MLTHADIRLLEFEERHPRHTGLKADAIRHHLGMSGTRYYQRLDDLAQRREVAERWPRTADRVLRRSQRRLDQREQFRQWL